MAPAHSWAGRYGIFWSLPSLCLRVLQYILGLFRFAEGWRYVFSFKDAFEAGMETTLRGGLYSRDFVEKRLNEERTNQAFTPV